MAETDIRLGIRLTAEEHRMLAELSKQQYPENERAQSMMIRRLIRQEYTKQERSKQK